MTTKPKTDCKTKGLCQYDSLTRTRFFHGMLLTDEHLRAEQTYHREALKRLNRHLWGSGIVCGLEVKATSGLCIQVHPGLALDCHGNVIDVCKCTTIDLSDLCKKKYPDGCAPAGSAPITTYLVLRYVEVPADPEPVLTPDDDCTPTSEGTKCEASKYREGFCLEFRDECPDPDACYEGATDDKDNDDGPGLLATFLMHRRSNSPYDAEKMRTRVDCMKSPPCPDCGCGESVVAIATLEIDCDKNTVKVTCDCRRYLWSHRLLRSLVCELLEGIDKLPRDVLGTAEDLPKASLFARLPVRAAWEAGSVLAGAPDRVNALETRVAEIERQLKGATAEPRAPRKPKGP
jgi:hypothetical protein